MAKNIKRTVVVEEIKTKNTWKLDGDWFSAKEIYKGFIFNQLPKYKFSPKAFWLMHKEKEGKLTGVQIREYLDDLVENTPETKMPNLLAFLAKMRITVELGKPEHYVKEVTYPVPIEVAAAGEAVLTDDMHDTKNWAQEEFVIDGFTLTRVMVGKPDQEFFAFDERALALPIGTKILLVSIRRGGLSKFYRGHAVISGPGKYRVNYSGGIKGVDMRSPQSCVEEGWSNEGDEIFQILEIGNGQAEKLPMVYSSR